MLCVDLQIPIKPGFWGVFTLRMVLFDDSIHSATKVVHLALRALRISTSKRVPSTLRGEGNRQDGIVLDYALCIVSPIKLTQAEV